MKSNYTKEEEKLIKKYNPLGYMQVVFSHCGFKEEKGKRKERVVDTVFNYPGDIHDLRNVTEYNFSKAREKASDRLDDYKIWEIHITVNSPLDVAKQFEKEEEAKDGEKTNS